MKNKANSGLTLIETIVVVAIMGVVMAAASAAVFSVIQSSALNRRLSEDQMAARLAMLTISRDIRQSVSATATPHALALVSPTNVLTPDGSAHIIQYTFDGTTLHRNVFFIPGAGQPQVPYDNWHILYAQTEFDNVEFVVNNDRVYITVWGLLEQFEFTTAIALYRIAG